MNGTLPKLPVGIQEFEKLRAERYLYVDKTRHLIDLIDSGTVYFLSRPRRFGKSLTVSTFDALFSGRGELFEGLYAQEFLDRPGFQLAVDKPALRYLRTRRAAICRGMEQRKSYSLLK